VVDWRDYLSYPADVAVDAAGNVYVADAARPRPGGGTIRAIIQGWRRG
jgi:DNA-binding beta-propeller fold protein YncE